MWIVQNSLEQLVVSILQQLGEVWQVGRTEPTALAVAQKSFYALSVLGGIVKQLHAGDAYISLDTTIAR